MYILSTLEFPTHNFNFHLLTTSVNAKYYYNYITLDLEVLIKSHTSSRTVLYEHLLYLFHICLHAYSATSLHPKITWPVKNK